MCPKDLSWDQSLFINYLETRLSSKVAKSVDDTILCLVVKTRRVSEELQKDLSNRMIGYELSVTDQERNLGVLVDNSIKVSTEYVVEVKKENSMLGIIRNVIENKIVTIIMPLYKLMKCQHLKNLNHLKGSRVSLQASNSLWPGFA